MNLRSISRALTVALGVFALGASAVPADSFAKKNKNKTEEPLEIKETKVASFDDVFSQVGEIKTDLDLERLPSGKFATNDLILHLAQLAYNILRLMGQLGMTGELSPVRHPAKRRRLRTVLQELVHRAALVIHKARQIILDFGQDIGRMTVLKTLRSRLRYPRGTPC